MSDKKKIVLVSHNDILGGAAIVTFRLMKALRALGHDAEMLVFNKMGDDPDVHQIGLRPMRGWKFIIERAKIMRNNGYSRENLFKVSTASDGMAIHRNRRIRNADVVMINWINQGMVSLSGLRHLCQQGKKVIWTMHDMWCMTGICHHALECTAYRNQCGNCRFLGEKAAPDDLSHKVWLKKKALYDGLPVKFVAVSNWLREKANRSSLLRGHDIAVIPNAFPVNSFPTTSERPFEMPYKNYFKNIITFGAVRLDDPIKGIRYAVDALNILYDEEPEIAAGAIAIFFGSTRSDDILQNLKFPHVALGTISDPTTLHQLYCASKVVLSTSLYESLPGTLIEGQSSGAIPVTFGNGGQADIIDHRINGYIATFPDTRDIANGIKWAINSDISREDLHDSVAEKFSSTTIARRYLDLIDKM